MLSSRKIIEPRSRQSSTSRTILLGCSGTGHRSSSRLFSFHREFSWASKHRDITTRTGKICKGFSTQDLSGKVVIRKQLNRNALWGNHHHHRRCLPRHAPIQERRSLSSWGNKPERPSSSGNHDQANEEDDWYSKWEKQKLKQYDEFVKRVEQDPYTALFGKTWQNLGGENPESRTHRPFPESPRETSVPKNERTRENWLSNSKSSSTKIPNGSDTVERQSKSETIPFQEHGQEYEIDPITNRKVFKTSVCSVSTLGHSEPQAKDGGKVYETFYKRWNVVSPTSLDHRFTTVEHEQVLSSSDSPSKDTPPAKPQNRKEWLAQEGFGCFQDSKADPQPTPPIHDAKPNTTATKIENALDRHLNRKSSIEKEKSNGPKLQYKPEENTAEDIDLLRPSDVRASAGLRGKSPKETDVDKQARRTELEKKYENCSPDRPEAASNHLQKEEGPDTVRKNKETDLRFGSWSKGTFQGAEPQSKDASKDTSPVSVNGFSEARDFDADSVNKKSNSVPLSKDEVAPQPLNVIASEAQIKVRDKASKLKAEIVPFKAKLDAMKADYEFLRQEWLKGIRILAAKKEEEMRAQEISKRTREIHEEEVKNQKVAMEAMEMRGSNRTTNTAKNASSRGARSDDTEQPTPRRLQSFFQGEGDMASNVHEFAGRDRWYKRKAPHAMNAKDAENDAKLQKAAKDRALIREIRGIYEETYGTIDTKHRQSHDLSTPPTEISAQPIAPSSGMVDAHAQLPSSAVGIAESSTALDKSQISEALVIIQKLFGQLREAQSIIQNHQSQTKQTLDANTQSTDISNSLNTFEKSVTQILTSLRLTRVRHDRMIDRVSVEANSAASSKEPRVIHPPSTTAPKPINLEVQKAPRPSSYRIFAYDPATETVKSAEPLIRFMPFSKEESLLPLDALNRLSNPAKFLSHVMSLGAEGYEPVSATTNVLVFKKELTPQDMEKANDRSLGSRSEIWPVDRATKEYVNSHQAQSQGTKGENVKEAQEQAVEETERDHQKAEKPIQTVTDGILEEKQAFEGAQKGQSPPPPPPPPPSSSSPSHTTTDRVHRQETVFSGSRHGKWIDHSAKSKRRRRAADKRRKMWWRILEFGTFTAAWCYLMGVVFELD